MEEKKQDAVKEHRKQEAWGQDGAGQVSEVSRRGRSRRQPPEERKKNGSVRPKIFAALGAAVALAAVSAAIGVSLLGQAVHMPAAVLALLIGGVLGHIAGIDRRLSRIAKLLPDTGGSETAQTLLVAFSLYCISTTGVIGALNLGFQGDAAVLTTKAIMDFSATIFFAAGSGLILAVISLPLVFMLFLFYGLSNILMPCLTPEMIGDFSAWQRRPGFCFHRQ